MMNHFINGIRGQSNKIGENELRLAKDKQEIAFSQ